MGTVDNESPQKRWSRVLYREKMYMPSFGKTPPDGWIGGIVHFLSFLRDAEEARERVTLPGPAKFSSDSPATIKA